MTTAAGMPGEARRFMNTAMSALTGLSVLLESIELDESGLGMVRRHVEAALEEMQKACDQAEELWPPKLFHPKV